MARASLVLLVTLSWVAPARSGPPNPRPQLTLREAERAIDLGWQAELAGDYAGERAALLELVETSTLSEEAAARERVRAWLETIDRREAAFRSFGRSARAYHDALLTLKDFGLKRADRIWSRAIRDLPQAARVLTSSSALRLRIELLRGEVDRDSALKALTSRLQKEGLRVERDGKKRVRYESRLNIDASDVVEQARAVRVSVAASMIVREVARPGEDRLIASISKHRAETRRTAGEARKMAVRRALDDAADSLVLQIRAQVLSDLASTEAKG